MFPKTLFKHKSLTEYILYIIKKAHISPSMNISKQVTNFLSILFWLLLSLVFFGITWNRISYGDGSKEYVDWVQGEARLVSYTAPRTKAGPRGPIRTGMKVEYKYKYDRVNYTSETMGPMSSDDKDYLLAFARAWSRGDTFSDGTEVDGRLPCYINPKKPKEAVLFRSNGSFLWGQVLFFGILGLVFFAVAIISIIELISPSKKSNKSPAQELLDER